MYARTYIRTYINTRILITCTVYNASIYVKALRECSQSHMVESSHMLLPQPHPRPTQFAKIKIN